MLDDPLDGASVLVAGSEVPRAGKLWTVLMKFFRERQISAQRFQDVLPGSGCHGIANLQRRRGFECAHDVGDQAISGPVAAADDIAGARCGYGDSVLRVTSGRKE